MGCSFIGWGVFIWDGMIVNGMECYFPGWGVSKREGALIYSMSSYTVFGMGC